jgi:hypothetical protein
MCSVLARREHQSRHAIDIGLRTPAVMPAKLLADNAVPGQTPSVAWGNLKCLEHQALQNPSQQTAKHLHAGPGA